MPRPVFVVDYDPQWQAIYEEEKDRIFDLVEDKILGIEHIGSTSVAGLGAKPIIDMMAGVVNLVSANELLPLLESIGYSDVTPEPGDQEWYYCLGKEYRRGEVRLQGFHLHLMKFGSATWKRHILFRDFLRTHSDVAQKYDKFKRETATKYRLDREGYTNSKTGFIGSVVRQARKDQMKV